MALSGPVSAPTRDLFPIPEFAEPDRRNLCAGVGVYVSAPRVIENFLDMGHFPYVHTDILGDEPHTEVKDYDVEVSDERDKEENSRHPLLRLQPNRRPAHPGEPRSNIISCAASLLFGALQILLRCGSRIDVIAIFAQPPSEERSAPTCSSR